MVNFNCPLASKQGWREVSFHPHFSSHERVVGVLAVFCCFVFCQLFYGAVGDGGGVVAFVVVAMLSGCPVPSLSTLSFTLSPLITGSVVAFALALLLCFFSMACILNISSCLSRLNARLTAAASLSRFTRSACCRSRSSLAFAAASV